MQPTWGGVDVRRAVIVVVGAVLGMAGLQSRAVAQVPDPCLPAGGSVPAASTYVVLFFALALLGLGLVSFKRPRAMNRSLMLVMMFTGAWMAMAVDIGSAGGEDDCDRIDFTVNVEERISVGKNWTVLTTVPTGDSPAVTVTIDNREDDPTTPTTNEEDGGFKVTCKTAGTQTRIEYNLQNNLDPSVVRRAAVVVNCVDP